jgi:hypothetical protein
MEIVMLDIETLEKIWHLDQIPERVYKEEDDELLGNK